MRIRSREQRRRDAAKVRLEVTYGELCTLEIALAKLLEDKNSRSSTPLWEIVARNHELIRILAEIQSKGAS